ncbi:MAG: anti-sigma factor [Kofleriaceae bacterium]|nr:anti-sigma factor [Kofleriaceae bacterium]
MSAVDLERVEVLAAYVSSGGASEEEVRELEQLVLASPEAKAIADEFEEGMSDVAMDLEWEAPPPGGLEALQAAIASDSSEQAAAPATSGRDWAPGETASAGNSSGETPIISLASRKPKSSKILVASSLLLFSAAAAMAVMWTQERNRNQELNKVANELRSDLDGLKTDMVAVDREWSGRLADYQEKAEIKLARFEMLQSPQLTLATLGAESGATIKIFMEPEGKRWLVYGFDLPDVADKDYQFWFVPKEGAPIPAGIFKSLGDGIHELEVLLPDDITNITQAAVSLEPKGGSESPTEVQMIGPI